MDQFYKVRKKMSIAESTRQVLNKSIDLLHKLSNKKQAKEEIKHQLSNLLSSYFFAIYPDSNPINFDEVDEGSKMKLEFFLEQAHEIVDKVANGRSPLYEAIMLMNKVVVNHQPNLEEMQKLKQEEVAPEQIEKPFRPELIEEPGMVPNEFDLSGEINEKKVLFDVKEKIRARTAMNQRGALHTDVSSLISEVLKKQEELHQSIFVLNDSLKEVGFELRPIQR
jgi:hypothetical protein